MSPVIPKFGIHTYRALINCPFPISPRYVWPNITLLFLALITPLRNSYNGETLSLFWKTSSGIFLFTQMALVRFPV